MDSTELVRFVAIAATLVSLTCSALLAGIYLTDDGLLATLWALVLGAKEIALAIAIYVNVLSPIPPTPGVRVYAWCSSTIAVLLVVLVVLQLRRTPLRRSAA